jgi:hypothetical protein
LIPAAAGEDVARIPAAAGEDVARFVTSRQDGVVRVGAAHAPPGWHVLLVGPDSVGAVEGGTAVPAEQGTLIHAAARTVVITLQ